MCSRVQLHSAGQRSTPPHMSIRTSGSPDLRYGGCGRIRRTTAERLWLQDTDTDTAGDRAHCCCCPRACAILEAPATAEHSRKLSVARRTRGARVRDERARAGRVQRLLPRPGGSGSESVRESPVAEPTEQLRGVESTSTAAPGRVRARIEGSARGDRGGGPQAGRMRSSACRERLGGKEASRLGRVVGRRRDLVVMGSGGR